MSVVQETTIRRYIGPTAGSKPSGVPIGSTYFDYQLGILHKTYDGTNWAVYIGVAGDATQATSLDIKTQTDKIGDVTIGLSAIKTAVNAVPTTAMRGTDNASLATSDTVPAADSAANVLERDVVGNKTDAAVEATTTTKSIMAYIKGLLDRTSRQLFSVDYWSVPQLSVVVPAGAASQALPNVVVASLPAGAVVVIAKSMLKFRCLQNANAANKLSGAQHIQIQKDGAGGYADAISLIDDQLTIAAAAVDAPGDVFMGDHNVVAKVDANATYNFQWTSANADVAGLTLTDVQTGIRIWYSI